MDANKTNKASKPRGKRQEAQQRQTNSGAPPTLLTMYNQDPFAAPEPVYTEEQYREQGPRAMQGATTTWVSPQVESAVTLPRQKPDRYAPPQMHSAPPFPPQDPYYPPPQGYPPQFQQDYPPMQPPIQNAPMHYGNMPYEAYPPQTPLMNSSMDRKPRPESFVSKKEPKCIYGCIPYKKRPRIICCTSLFLFLLISGILLFMFFPR